ncbi:MAG TPA: PAS domain S-box protein [Kofleriaceae bacterium]|nr:PAS domain S-box protein [Kofleriaceae bacterium]
MSNDDLAEFLDGAPVPAHSVNPSGTIVWANRAELKLLGYRAEEYIGHPIAKFHADPLAAADLLARLLRGETVRDHEIHLRARDGSLRHLAISANMLVREGRPVCARVFSRDISRDDSRDDSRDVNDRRRAGGEDDWSAAPAAPAVPAVPSDAAHSEARFRLLVEAVEDYAIFMLDPDGRVATWNAGARRIKGYEAREIIGRHFSVFYPEDDLRAGKTEYELEVASREGRFEDEGWRLRKDGSRFWANVVITALRAPDGHLVGFAKVTRDLTERRKLETERVQLAHAQEAIRLRDEFLSLASHELKTPLAVLQLQLEVLHDRIGTGDPAVLAKIERGSRACLRLAELIEALLDVSRIATGRFELQLQRSDLSEIVAGAVDRMHEIAEAAGCALSITTEPAPGVWDRSRIDQVITNLVSNAIRYAAGAPIEIAVSATADTVTIEVRDHGPGLPDGQLARIFERFERAASMRHYGGLGLGLYVVRQIIEAHGGSVSAKNATGGGACFTVRLPLGSSPSDLVT